jgi:hypothetical protein
MRELCHIFEIYFVISTLIGIAFNYSQYGKFKAYAASLKY